MEINNTSLNTNRVYHVLHFGDQCPWRLWVIEQARQAALETGGVVDVFDVSLHPRLAEQYRLFYPFMTVIDEKIIIPSPTPAARLVQMVNEGMTIKPAPDHAPAVDGQAEKIIPITAENIADTCTLCIPQKLTAGCAAKQAWAQSLSPKIPAGIFGFGAVQGKEILGVVEFLPSQLVPYPLPEKDSAIAFITCIYSSQEANHPLDYRGQVLEHLLDVLPKQGYRKVQVVAGRRTAYPNGPAAFFEKHGFDAIQKLGAIFLGDGEEELALMEKII